MANAWLRLWHDMPNDPKWRTIARVSKQPVATVQAVFIHLLVSASRNVTRGHIDVTTEDLASALDVTEDEIDSILQAMQGRVLDGEVITGWAKRQVIKEDIGNTSPTAKTPAERKRAQREREKLIGEINGCHDESRNVTHMSRRVTTDTDTDTDTDIKTDLTQPKSFPDRRDFRDYVAGVLEGKLSGHSASEFHESAIAALQAAGLNVCCEYPVSERGDGREGRIDIVVIDGNGVRCGIELDRNSPRQKSLFKLGSVEVGICVLRLSGIARRIEQNILVIGGAIQTKKFNPLNVVLPDWLSAPLWSEWIEFRRALGKPVKTPQGANGAIRELDKFRQQGFTPEQVIRHSIAHEYQGLYPPKEFQTMANSRNINSISQPDNTIPPGFKG